MISSQGQAAAQHTDNIIGAYEGNQRIDWNYVFSFFLFLYEKNKDKWPKGSWN